WFSDVLYLLFGNLAWFFPLILVWGAVNLFRERRSAHLFSWEVFGLRAAGFFLLLLSSTALATLHFATELQASAGGLLGQTLVDTTLASLKLAGSTLVFLTLLFVGLTLGMGISWLRLVDAVGLRCLQGWSFLALKWTKWREKQREEREAREMINQRKQAFEHYVEKERKRKPIESAPAREVPKQPSKRVQKEKQGRLF